MRQSVMRLGLVSVFLLGGCGKEHGADRLSANPPTWLSELPSSKDELCAVGVSGPTYYQEDAVTQSKSQALTELARTWEVKVKAELTVREQGDSHGSGSSVRQESAFASDVVLKLAQVRAMWVHPGGEPGYGLKGTVFTLICMPRRVSATR